MSVRVIHLKRIANCKWGLYTLQGIELSSPRYFDTKAKAEDWAKAWASTWVDIRVETIDE